MFQRSCNLLLLASAFVLLGLSHGFELTPRQATAGLCRPKAHAIVSQPSFCRPHGTPIGTSSIILRAEKPQNDLMTTSSSSSPLDKPILAALDLISLLVFAAVGKSSHASNGSLDIVAVLAVAFPFVVAWFSTSFLTGVYSSLDSLENVSSSVSEEQESSSSSSSWLTQSWIQTAKGWIVAIPLGCVGRGLIKGYVPPLPFVVVTMIATLVILGGTRTAYNFVTVGRKEMS
jgi:hypothetical protein